MMKKTFLLCLIVLCQCQPSSHFKQEDIIGTWKADSIYNYANGFGYWIALPDSHEEVVYQYDTTGYVFQKKEDEKRGMRYSVVDNDSLIYVDTAGKLVSGYKILVLTPTKLVLKKHHQPLFPGKNQEAFEIRVFSPLRSDNLSAVGHP